MPDPFRAYVTDIDSYAFFSASKEMTSAEFLERLRGEEDNDDMRAGRIAHEALELAEAGEEIVERQEGDIRVNFEKLEAELTLPDASQREVRVSGAFETSSGLVELRGRIDGIIGATGVDWKFSRKPDAEIYANAWQWRLYLLLNPDLDEFSYYLFKWGSRKVKAHKDLPKESKEKHHLFRVKKISGPFTFYRYANLERDCLEIMAAFCDWSQRAGWEGRPEREENAAK